MKVRRLQTNFTGGEISPELLGRSDLPLYNNGAARLRNCRPRAAGGAKRRSGTAHVASLVPQAYQHVEWIFNAEQTYQLLFSHHSLGIHDGVTGVALQNHHDAPWVVEQIGHLSIYSQGDYTFVCHPDMPPQQIRRTSAVTFVIEPYVFDRSTSGAESPVWQPYHRYVRDNVVMTVELAPLSVGYDDIHGYAAGAEVLLKVPSMTDFFVPDHVGTFFQVGNAQFEVTEVTLDDPSDPLINQNKARAILRSANFRLRLTENPMTLYEGTNTVTVFDPFHGFIAGSVVTLLNAVPFLQVSYAQLNGTKGLTGADASTWSYSSNLSGTDPPAESTSTGGGPDIEYWSSFVQTVDWKEQMYSVVRGWPHCVGGFQGRLILGGGRSSPNRLNFSRLEAPFNFDVGTGQDDDAIQIGVSGRRTPTIKAVVGADHVQIFSSEGEHYVPHVEDQAALTPATISVRQQTYYGSWPQIAPVPFDGATLFISRNGANLRQLVFGEKGYSAPDLSFVAGHLLTDPYRMAVQMEDLEQGAATAFVVNSDGTMPTFIMMRTEKVAAWAQWETAGLYRSACAVDNRVFFIVERIVAGGARTWLEKLDHTRVLDASAMGVYVGPSPGPGPIGVGHVWGGFGRFVNQPISVVVNGWSDIGLFTPNGLGQITIPVRADFIEGGLGFSPHVRTPPPELALPDGPTLGEPRRVVAATVNVHETLGMQVRANKVLNTKAHLDLGLPAQPVTGTVNLPMLGWDTAGQVDITQSSNAPFLLLSINLELEF